MNYTIKTLVEVSKRVVTIIFCFTVYCKMVSYISYTIKTCSVLCIQCDSYSVPHSGEQCSFWKWLSWKAFHGFSELLQATVGIMPRTVTSLHPVLLIIHSFSAVQFDTTGVKCL